jgi:2,3-dihydroxybenzoate decarboxylase
LPLQDPKAAADELERAVAQLGFKGALVNGHTNGEYLDERKFWGVWERAEQLGVPIYLHPADSPSDQMKIYQGYPGLRSAVWNWTVETATHALRIICSGIFDAFPKVTLLLGHIGEALPYTLQRIDEGYSPEQTASTSAIVLCQEQRLHYHQRQLLTGSPALRIDCRERRSYPLFGRLSLCTA